MQTIAPVKVLTVREPYATAIVLGFKPWETRTGPPTGSTRPDGVSGVPGHSLDAGERVLIAASAKPPLLGRFGPLHVERLRNGRRVGYLCTLDIPHKPFPHDSCREAGHSTDEHLVTLRPGHLLGSVRYDHPVPIVGGANHDDYWGGEYIVDADGLMHCVNGACSPMEDQRTLGDWTNGRWAWRLTDPTPLGTGCPLCGMNPGDALIREEFDPSEPNAVLVPCRVCGGEGTDGPVRVRGNLGVWAL